MENPARNNLAARDRDLPSWVMPTATVVAFGGALAVYGLGPAGILAAGLLLGGWVVLALKVAERQRRCDIAAGRIAETPPRKPSRLARTLQLFLLVGAGACYAYGAWLQQQGAEQAATQGWTDGALLLVVLAGVFALVTDTIELALSRLRARQAKTS